VGQIKEYHIISYLKYKTHDATVIFITLFLFSA